MNSHQIVARMLQEVFVLQKRNQFSEADALCHRVLSASPGEFEALHLLGISAGRQGDFVDAVNWLLKAIQVRPESARSHNDLGIVLSKLGQLDQALVFLNEAVRLRPEFPEAYVNLGNVYFGLALLEQATRCYQKALLQRADFQEADAKLRQMKEEGEQLEILVETVRRQIRSNDSELEGAERPNVKLPRRELLPHLFNQLGFVEDGVEVGVQTGHFSELLLRNWNGRRLYSIDPWKEFGSEEYVDDANVSQATHDELYKTTIKRLMPFQAKSVIWRLTSKEAADLIPGKSLDFCYLDGDHSREGVCEDLRLWHPKVKPGGLLGGHDYVPDGSYDSGEFGVKGAVDEFAASHRLRLFTSSEKDSDFPSWLVVLKGMSRTEARKKD